MIEQGDEEDAAEDVAETAGATNSPSIRPHPASPANERSNASTEPAIEWRKPKAAIGAVVSQMRAT